MTNFPFERVESIVGKGENAGNLSMKLLQNLSSGFREDFLGISSCPYSAKSPHSTKPCLLMDQNFANNF